MIDTKRRKMPDLDFMKVKRKIRSVPASPKQSPTRNKSSGFTWKLRKKSADASVYHRNGNLVFTA